MQIDKVYMKIIYLICYSYVSWWDYNFFFISSLFFLFVNFTEFLGKKIITKCYKGRAEPEMLLILLKQRLVQFASISNKTRKLVSLSKTNKQKL